MKLFQRRAIGIGADAAIAAPGFDYATLDLGLSIELGPRVRSRIGSSITTNPIQGADGSGRRGYFGMSLDVTYGPVHEETPPRRSPPISTVASSRLYDSWILAAGFRTGLGTVDTEPPDVRIGTLNTSVISPNGDGELDSVVFPVTIRDTRGIRSYELVVRNDAGTRIFRAGSESNEDGELHDLPQTLTWNGRSTDGNVVPDGEYTLTLHARDLRGNSAESAAPTVLVDTTPPSADLRVTVADTGDSETTDSVTEGGATEASAEQHLFSPNDDGNRDVILITQTELSEGSWRGEIIDGSGTVYRSWDWSETDGLATTVFWDGRNDAGELVPDGGYRYRLQGEDAAGNSFKLERSGIIKSVRSPSVSVSIGRAAFSPNGDGRADTLELLLQTPEPTQVASWTIRVTPAGPAAGGQTEGDGFGGAFVFKQGRNNPPNTATFAGFDLQGNRLEEGRYRARFSVRYRNGNEVFGESPVFVIDTTAPQIAVTGSSEVFSPDGDGNQDRVTFFHDAGRAEHWRGVIRDNAGKTIREYEWQETPPTSLTWDGTTGEGKPAGGGTYKYQVTGTDAAANERSSRAVSVRLDLGETGVVLSAGAGEKVFSPNADGVKDQLPIFARISREEAVAAYELSIYSMDADSDGEPAVRTLRGSSAPDRLSWDGFDNRGTRVPDGSYRITLNITYRNATVERSEVTGIRVDTTPPQANVETPYTLFSPNSDGNRDLLPIRQDGSPQELWEGQLRNATGEVVKNWYWKAIPRDFEWDGTDAAGNLVADGSYSYHLSSRDTAGNSATRELRGIRVDTRVPELFLTVTRAEISPNGDEYLDETTVRSYLSMTEGVSDWRLDFIGPDGNVIRSMTGARLQSPLDLRWDGSTTEGSIAHGAVIPRLTVSYTKGDVVEARGPEIRVDAKPPAADAQLSPIPFAPDGDGVRDTLSIALSVSDDGEIAGWEFRILDPEGDLFRGFQGRGTPPESLRWNGRSADGDRVVSAETYSYRYEVTDALGNVAVADGRIPIDILLVRESGRWKVEIADITFPRDSAELVTDPYTERGARNAAVIERLAGMLQRYPDYELIVEGHAVNESGSEEKERQEAVPRAEARAEAVRRALMNAGIRGARLTAVGRGSSKPVVPHTNVDERWRNRRVEFLLRR